VTGPRDRPTPPRAAKRIWVARCGQCGGDTYQIAAPVDPPALTTEGIVAACVAEGCSGALTLADVFRVYLRETGRLRDAL
jgi:hypothetical protein